MIQFLLKEKDRFILWAPVIFGIGIALYYSFSIPIGISLIVAGVALIFAILSYKFYQKSHEWWLFVMIVSATVFLMASGAAVSAINSRLIAHQPLKEELGPVMIKGTVGEIDKLSSGYRVVLSKIDIWEYPPEKTPKKIRLIVRTSISGAAPGDIIMVKAKLLPLPKAVYPGAYDFSESAYFKGLGATGFAVTPFKIVEHKDRITENIEALRYHITQKFYVLAGDTGAIAAALITGERAAISKEANDEMRASGLYHLLSISGLHLIIVVGGFFWGLRAFLALFPYIALRVNIKLWSMVAALIAGLFYLIIAGMPVTGVRSYMMVALAFTAIIIGRMSVSLELVAWSAMIILIISPYEIMNPSFQMSFAAVTAIIAFYEEVDWFNPENERGWIKRILVGLSGIAASSLIAGIAVAPFSIYHFGQYSAYGIISNMIAIPITTFIVMPMGMLSLILMTLGLELPALTVMGWGIDIVMWCAKIVSSLPYSQFLIPAIPKWALILSVVSGLWLVIWQTKTRYLGIIGIFASALILFFPNTPDIIIDGSGKLFAIKTSSGELAFSNFKSAKYSRSTWLKIAGQKKAIKLKEINDPSISCDDEKCTYERYNKVIRIFYDGNLVTDNFAITPTDLNQKGTHAIWVQEDEIKVKTTTD